MWQLFRWQDGIEIIFFSMLIYYTTRWLFTHRTRHIIYYIIGYTAFLGICQLLQLDMIATFLVTYCPVLLLIAIIVQEQKLQHNFLFSAPTRQQIITPHTTTPTSWLEVLMSIFITHMQKGETIFCIIEGNDTLDAILTTPYLLNVPICYNLLSLICNSKDYEHSSCIWITKQGILKGINATLKQPENSAPMQQTNLIDHLLTVASYTDALILISHPQEHNCTLVVKNSLFNHISTTAALQLLKKQLHYISFEGINYEKKSTAEQNK